MIQHFCEVAGDKTTKRLVFIFHGYGASADTIIDLGEYWSKSMPHTRFIAPNAPHFVPTTYGFQWFPIGDLESEVLQAGCVTAAPMVCDFVQSMQAKHNVSWQETALVGFSQGAMLALYTGLSRKNLCRRILAYSGGLYMEEKDMHANPTHTDILLVHGDRDEVVPVTASIQAKQFLEKAGFSSALEIVPGLEHCIDAQGLEAGVLFLT